MERKQIHFGRDSIGRRSLLFAYHRKLQQLVVSSIAYKSEQISCSQWMQVSNAGIYCIDLQTGKLSLRRWPKQQSNTQMNDLFVSPNPLSVVNYDQIINAFLNILIDSIRKRVTLPNTKCNRPQHRYLAIPSAIPFYDGNTNEIVASDAHFGILYSGGIDSRMLAALMDKVLDDSECIDLINVSCGEDAWQSPDRLTAINGLLEL